MTLNDIYQCMIKKIICWLFGHKNPLGKNKAFIHLISEKIDKSYYVMKVMPCARCCGYFEFEKNENQDFVDLADPTELLH